MVESQIVPHYPADVYEHCVLEHEGSESPEQGGLPSLHCLGVVYPAALPTESGNEGLCLI